MVVEHRAVDLCSGETGTVAVKHRSGGLCAGGGGVGKYIALLQIRMMPQRMKSKFQRKNFSGELIF